MINTLIFIAKMLAAILPFIILCLASRKVNLPKPDRSKQFLMPVITLVYAIVGMVLLNKINEWLLNLINSIPKWISALASISWMPAKVGEVFLKIGDYLTDLIAKINFGFWIFFISNAVIVLAYIIVKKFCIKIIAKAVKMDGRFHSAISGNFYNYYTDKNKWCVKENYVQVRGMFKLFYYSAVVLSSLLMLVSRWFYASGLLKTVFYPVFGILIVGELYFYLDGLTRREYSAKILGEDEEAYKTVNYSLLRKFLRSIFGDRLLTENTSINNALAYDITTDELVSDLENSEDQKVVAFATYMGALNKTGFNIDHNYLHSSLDMLNGKSILFNNPFYNDLIPYAFYPMNRVLLSHKKVLIVLGRHSIEEDIKSWVEQGIESITNIPFLWNIGVLNAEPQDIDIGIVTRSDVLNISLHNANSEFLENVGFVVIIEPSKLMSTAQIGLNMLVKKCRADDKNIVFCMCDMNCDGLVDALSHALMTSITEVSATNKHLGTSSYMCWEVGEEYLHHRIVPNISRYLGMGTEFSFAALKNQVSKTRWYGGEAFPVVDMRWIAKQYYYDLTKYANLPTSQDAMDEYFNTTANFWSAKQEKYNYLTVEDESNNMFEILRDFSTRTTEQGFFNIISSDYILKDYMAENASIFEADAKAIPFIAPDYTRSNRNTILRLILMISTYPVPSKVLEKELSLLGITIFDLKKQLWYEMYNCYSPLLELPDDYRDAVNDLYARTLVIDNTEFTHDIIEVNESFNIKLGKMETLYSISDASFLHMCVSELRSASYVAEDEVGQKNYLGAELSGHIYQKYLPGQFFTFGGKYYEMQYLTADGQVLLRRAADHITGRPQYRQIRDYVIHGYKPSDRIGAQQDIGGMKIIKEYADISVMTRGYYRMDKYNDFATAKRVLFEGEKSGIPKRVYNNKEILCIELPDFGGKLNDNIRYTITVLLNEIFKTIFADNQAFICAVTDESFLEDGNAADPLTYTVKGEGCELRSNSIYIIEDSQLDLGLTVAVERNLQRIFDIIHDYLDWHIETMELSLNPPEEPQPPVTFSETEEQEEPKKKGIIRRFFSAIGSGIKKVVNKIKGWFKRKKKKDEPKDGEGETEGIAPEVEPTGEPTGETPANGATPEGEVAPEGGEVPESGKINPPEEAEKEPKKKGVFGWFKRKKKSKPAKDSELNGTDIPEKNVEEIVVDGDGEPISGVEKVPEGEPAPDGADAEGEVKDPAETAEAPGKDEISYSSDEDEGDMLGFSAKRKPYHERYYMLFGANTEPAAIDISGALDYLIELSTKSNPLKQARESKKIAEFVEATFKPGKPDARYCDFCGTEIFGVEYETLADGRDRCIHCGRTAIKTGEEFRKIFEDVKRNMESFFGIRINTGIKVEMVNSKTLHKRLGKAYIPTPKSDGRVLGVAISDKNGYTLLVENGSPRMASMLTMAHELTHIWQYLNWKDKAIRKKYGKKMRLEIYEGMAKWVEIQYAYLINEPVTAKREEIITSYRDDEYGHGFLRYRANYPFSRGTVITKRTPFMDIETPLDLQYCGAISVNLPTDGVNPGDIDNGTPAAGTPSAGGKGPTIEDPLPKNPTKGPIERNPDSVYKYAYNLLNDDEKAAYDTVLEAFCGFAEEITSFAVPLTREQMKKVVDYVYRDHPEIFWIQQGGATYYFDEATQIVSHIKLTYCMSNEEAESRREEINAVTKTILSKLTDSMSDYEVTLKIYESIIDLVDYDTIGLERQKNDAAADVVDDLRSVYGALVNKKAVCAGYSKAMQYLLNLCGIECTYVRSDTHAWNLIKLEGDYYHLDVTWGDASNTKKEKDNGNEINYDCFCITTADLARLESHTPESDFPLPECTSTKCNYHRRNGLYFESFDFNMIRAIVCEYVKLGKLNISFRFGSPEVFGEAKKQLITNSKIRSAMQYAMLKTGARLDLSYAYSCREEKLVIAFYMKKI